MQRVCHPRRIVFLVLVIGSLCLVGSTAQARVSRTADAGPGETIDSPSDQPPSASCQRCCDRCITYRHHATLRKICCGCDDPVKTVLQVNDPCCCCCVEIPVCLPACCDGCPKITCHSGIRGRQTVTYEWCCGYKVRIVFDRCGDVVVHSYGR